MRCGAIIQARLSSTRLCHKVLEPIDVPRPDGNGIFRYTVLTCVIWAAKAARDVNEVLVTSPDRAICMIAHMHGCARQEWSGPRDPLAEYYTAASKRSYGLIVRLTADCPMLTGAIIYETIKKHLDKMPQVRYTYNSTDGVDVEVFDFEALKEAYEKAGSDEREHVTTWIRKNLMCQYLDPIPGEYLSLNTAEDLDKIRILMGKRRTEIGGNTTHENAGCSP